MAINPAPIDLQVADLQAAANNFLLRVSLGTIENKADRGPVDQEGLGNLLSLGD